ncbi:MAG: hypothetical protein CMC48_10450 [Flavobacteriaceae bacterium]|nr:hypothetical protein [Flavobacteriaceae bacterium]MAR44466.1 hypothetical protein [Flavobacteriaceae bacterium]|tara:strand:+ start:1151 stop:2530 length:1380 start_codon:yes stop_codon:yes gene_type:complete
MKSLSDGFFSIDSKNGFLPIKEPLRNLPSRYETLQQLIDEMPVLKQDGNPGILANHGSIEEAIKILPNYLDLVKLEKDPFVNAALFRAYSFLASAYTLSPSHHKFLKTGKYGMANDRLPSNISQPFVYISNSLGVYPWLDYHYAYSLGNYFKIDKEKGFNWSNLSMAAKFSGMDDERGFIMLHVDINQHSPDLVKSAFGVANSKNNESTLNKSLKLFAKTLKKINERRRVMWEASRWKHYNDFRVFIMGIKGNEEIFPNGLIYEGVWDKPKYFRGQTGAQDNIIPTADIVSGVINFYPENQLTKYLLDLRKYRPICVQNFFEILTKEMGSAPLLKRLTKTDNQLGMHYLMSAYEEIYFFRNGHWQFVQKYIMQNTKYAKATGGTPIISWIPNQIKAVFSAMQNLSDQMKDSNHWVKSKWIESYLKKVELLNKQLEILSINTFNPESVFKLNEEIGLEDF